MPKASGSSIDSYDGKETLGKLAICRGLSYPPNLARDSIAGTPIDYRRRPESLLPLCGVTLGNMETVMGKPMLRVGLLAWATSCGGLGCAVAADKREVPGVDSYVEEYIFFFFFFFFHPPADGEK